MEKYRRFSEWLFKSRYAVALTGAGISVESGIPDFRSKDGLWSKYDPFEYAYIDSFRIAPGKVWNMLNEMVTLFDLVNPNDAHLALGELEKMGIIKTVITQNIDSLHQRGGSSDVVEFHGHFRSLHCDNCSRMFTREEVSLKTLPPRCSCGGPIRPDIVFFGEGIPREAYARALKAAERCDLMLVVGTSASVAPASELPVIAKRRGARLLEINPVASELTDGMTDDHIMEPAGKALRSIVGIMKSMRSHSEEID
jgi:NAD-dependent deacetylase